MVRVGLRFSGDRFAAGFLDPTEPWTALASWAYHTATLRVNPGLCYLDRLGSITPPYASKDLIVRALDPLRTQQ